MANSLPSDASKANCDSTADNPQLALTSDLAGVVDKFNGLLDVLRPTALANPGAGITTKDNGAGTPDDLDLIINPLSRTASHTPGASALSRLNVYTTVTTANRTVTLDSAAVYGNGWFTHYCNLSSYLITINASGAETISGRGSIQLRTGESVTLVCDGSNWTALGGMLGLVDLSYLADVDETITPSDGDVLMWDSVAGKWGPDGTLQNNGLIECQQSTTTSEQTGTSTYASYLTKTVTNLVAGDRIVVFAIAYYYTSLTSKMDTEPQMRITNSTDAETLRESETTGITSPQSNAGQLMPIILTGRTSAIGSSADRTITMEVRGRGDATGGGFLRFAFGNLFCFVERPAS